MKIIIIIFRTDRHNHECIIPVYFIKYYSFIIQQLVFIILFPGFTNILYDNVITFLNIVLFTYTNTNQSGSHCKLR